MPISLWNLGERLSGIIGAALLTLASTTLYFFHISVAMLIACVVLRLALPSCSWQHPRPS